MPAPRFHWGLVATTEFVGGTFLVVGFLARCAAIPLSITMVVALLTAKREQIERLFDLLGFEETTYAVVFLWIAPAGAGQASVDFWLWRRLHAHPPWPGSPRPSACTRSPHAPPAA